MNRYGALALWPGRSHFEIMGVSKDILDLVGAIKTGAEAVAVATVVRSARGGPARAGARAVIAADGAVSADWLGAAAASLAREALADGRPRFFRARDKDKAGAMDVLVEPLLPRPMLVIAGASPVAVALAGLARQTGFFVTVCAPDAGVVAEADRLVHGYAPPPDLRGEIFAVVATQGAGDREALRAMARLSCRYLAFVGPRRRFLALRRALAREEPALDAVRAPAGLDIGAITPEEIALSIVAEMVATRRRGLRRPRA